MTISRWSQSRRVPIDGSDGDRARPSGTEREAGREEVATLLPGVGASCGVPLGGRPRGVDDQARGDDPEPTRLLGPQAGK